MHACQFDPRLDCEACEIEQIRQEEAEHEAALDQSIADHERELAQRDLL